MEINMPLAKVQARGQVTLPRSVRRELGCKPGDTVAFQSAGHGAVEIRVLPRRSFAELLDRYRIPGEIDPSGDRAAWQAAAAQEVLKDSA
jgi:AbrB family looped-hinge helix DNA binding protein